MARPSDLSRIVEAPILAPRGRATGVLGHEARLGEWFGGEDVVVVAGV
jgi:hypothetical protein